MLKHVSPSALLFLVLFAYGIPPASADIYKYANEAGEISFADNLQSVPEQYRAIAVNTTALEEQKLIQSQPQTQPQANSALTQEVPGEKPAYKMTFTIRLLITVVVVFVWIVALFTIKKAGVLKGREKVLPAARVALSCILLVYLITVHGKDVVNLFTMAGNKIEEVQERQAQRGKKAGEAIKALNKLMEDAEKKPPASDQAEEKNN